MARREETQAFVKNDSGEDKGVKRAGGPKTKDQKRLEAEERQRRRDADRNGGASGGHSPAASPKKNGSSLSPQQLRSAHRDLESRIERKEAEKLKLEEALASPSLYDNAEKARTTTIAYQTIKDELASLYASWEELAEQLTSIE